MIRQIGRSNGEGKNAFVDYLIYELFNSYWIFLGTKSIIFNSKKAYTLLLKISSNFNFYWRRRDHYVSDGNRITLLELV